MPGPISNLKAPWRPGQSGNPKGRAKIPEHLRGIEALTPTEVARLVAKYARMTRDQIKAAAEDPSTPVLDAAIASVFTHAVRLGDYTRLAFLLDRAVGKLPSVAEPNEERDARDIQNLSDQELIRLVKDKLPEFEAT